MAKKGINGLIKRPSIPKKVVGVSIFALALLLGVGLLITTFASGGVVINAGVTWTHGFRNASKTHVCANWNTKANTRGSWKLYNSGSAVGYSFGTGSGSFRYAAGASSTLQVHVSSGSSTWNAYLC